MCAHYLRLASAARGRAGGRGARRGAPNAPAQGRARPGRLGARGRRAARAEQPAARARAPARRAVRRRRRRKPDERTSSSRARAQADRALGHLQTLRSMRGLGEPELQRIALDRVIAAVARRRRIAGGRGRARRPRPSALGRCRRAPIPRTCGRSSRTSSTTACTRCAAGGGGCVTIRVASEDGSSRRARLRRRAAARRRAARATLFEPLRSTKTQGLGLGLPIARALARAMRGDLSLEEADRKAFRLELPLRGAP